MRPLALIPVALLAACAGTDSKPDPETGGGAASSPVDPLIGTGGTGWYAGSSFPGAALPFGMVRVGPDTVTLGEIPSFPNHCAGYHADDDTILGFSQTHLHGTGIPDLGNLLVAPARGSVTADTLTLQGHASAFSHDTEDVRPGRYAVHLEGPDVLAEITATEHVAVHRYTFADSGEPGVLVFDAGYALPLGRILDGSLTVDPATGVVEGWTWAEGAFSKVYGGYRVYLSALVDPPPDGHGTWTGGTPEPVDGGTEAGGSKFGAWLSWDQPSTITLQVGVSFVSIESARANREAEVGDLPFDGVEARAGAAWDDVLDRVRWTPLDADQDRVLATALYHAFLMPTSYTDADGRYTGFDGQVHDAGDATFYSDLSLWDTYRNLHSLLVLVDPDHQRDFLVSLVRMGEQAGYLPKWPQATGESNIMIGTPADIVVADSTLKGITDFDVETAYTLMRATADGPVAEDSYFEGRPGIETYLAQGFVPADVYTESVSQTLEYAIADAAIAGLARALGRDDEADVYAGRALSYRNLWDPTCPCFRPRNADGSWVDIPDTLLGQAEHYTEGTPWQYTWLVPQDPAGLVDLIGSPEAVVALLETFMENGRQEWEAADRDQENDLDAIVEHPAYWWHGNEPDLHAPYLFALVGRPDLTQSWLRWICRNLYGTDRMGLPGNDDAGTLSAWLLFTSLGFYPLAGTTTYLVGAPQVPHAEVTLGTGGTLVVDAPGLSETAMYVQAVALDGVPLEVPWFDHAAIADGGTLVFAMGDSPSTWGVDISLPDGPPPW